MIFIPLKKQIKRTSIQLIEVLLFFQQSFLNIVILDNFKDGSKTLITSKFINTYFLLLRTNL